MTLRARLSLFFVAIVVVPLAGASIAVAVLVPREANERADERLRGAASAVASLRAEQLSRAEHAVARIARSLTPVAAIDRPERLEWERSFSGLDFVELGRSAAMRTPEFADAPAGPEVLDPDRVIAATATMPDGVRLRGGWFADNALARRLEASTEVGVAFRLRNSLVAGSMPDGSRTLTLPIEGSSLRMILSTERAHVSGGLALSLGAIGAVGLALACALGLALSRALSRPLGLLAEQADAIAAGDYSKRVPENEHDEAGRLGRAFNAMTDSVQAYVLELRSSRDELRKTLNRLGTTLGSTRGMREMLGAVLEAAGSSLGAEAGALFRVEADGTLSVQMTTGLEGAPSTRECAAAAIARREPVLGEDPLGRVVAAAPLEKGDEVLGAIALAASALPGSFGQYELTTLASFASQAAIAIDSVSMREEAERQALTDPLTGIPNRRALERMLVHEVERAHRYERPVSIVMIDLDHFKRVNDRYGHLEGDRVLVEACKRINAVVRAGVDSLARYGGEEFVLVLPETDGPGAIVVAEKILAAISTSPFLAAGGIDITASAGVASIPGDGPTAGDALHAADLALYRAKEDGRNRVVATASARRSSEKVDRP